MSREEAITAANEAASYLMEEADFNRSWIDGRRGADRPKTVEYTTRRIVLAEQRETWATAIRLLAK